jgi:rubredoxin
MVEKKNLQETKEYVQSFGYALLSQYKNARTNLDIQCDKGHRYEATWNGFQQGNRCPYCSEKKVTYSQVREHIEQQGYFLLSQQYKNNSTKLDVRCNKGHKYEVSWSNFRQGSRCPYCNKKKVTYQQVKDYIEQQGHYLLSLNYTNSSTNLDFECKEGHRYQMTWDRFKQGCRCPTCGNKKKGSTLRLTYQYIKNHIGQHGYVLLSKQYKNNNIKLNVQCNKKHQYKVTWGDFQQGCRCPKCNESKGEKKIAEILINFNLPFIRQHRLGDTQLRLDFFIPSLNLGIEYDGQHHFEPTRFGGISVDKAINNFKEQQQRDKSKNRVCKDLEIKLIRIPYNQADGELVNHKIFGDL